MHTTYMPHAADSLTSPCATVLSVAPQVVGLSKLRTKYESHEAKRQLCDSYDLFLADERIVPSLPKLIGTAGMKGQGWGRGGLGRRER